MGACNIILLLGISILNVLLPSVVCQSDEIFGCEVTDLDYVTEEAIVEPAEEIMVFGEEVPASGKVSIYGQSPGFPQTDGFQPWTPLYASMEPPYTRYIHIPTAYGPIAVPVPLAELLYPYMNWNPMYQIPMEYLGPSSQDDQDRVDEYTYSVPVSGRVRIEANLGNCNPYPYLYQGASGYYGVIPTINPEDYYDDETEVAPTALLKAKGKVTIAAKF